eukprot:5780416-Pleurochrysis_carterae.AAC.1
MCTPGLQPALGRLATLTCTHRTHVSLVGGSHDQHGWHSASHAAYPPDLNLAIAQAVASRISLAPATTYTTGRPELASSDPSSHIDAASRFLDHTDPNASAPTLSNDRHTDN